MSGAVKKTFLVVGILVLALVVTGAVLLSSKNVQKKLTPSLTEIKNLQVAITYDTANVSGRMGVHNPLPFTLTIDSLGYFILHQTDTLGKGFRKPETRLGKKTETFVPLALGVDFGLLQKRIEQLQGQDSTKLDLHLDVYFSVPLLGAQKINIDKPMPVNIPRLPVIAVHSMRVVDFGLGEGVEMEMTLALRNENLMDLRVSDISYTVTAEDFLDASEKLDKTYVVKAGKTNYPKVPLHLGVREAAKAKIKKHFGDKTWEVNVKGKAQVRSSHPMLQHMALNFSQKQTVDVSQTGKAGKEAEKKKDEDERDDKPGLLKRIKEKVF